ncbi:hypothetical protein BUALT_Bualt05G0075900 [Buddleja alternifolia]|uniref:Uncharacterized protein n=1 Tax=Buddleja alternifolia TaxID=168488 RepID=A0AAV6XTS7_9LAMI|nr:hypothetical protein BUALT_Bualt05G0075900 [Buddleja alternifolia]
MSSDCQGKTQNRFSLKLTQFIRKINCVGIYVGKSSWPELLGALGDLAVVTIERENPLVTANIVRCDRVRVYV